jgi:hypothetical protein
VVTHNDGVRVIDNGDCHALAVVPSTIFSGLDMVSFRVLSLLRSRPVSFSNKGSLLIRSYASAGEGVIPTSRHVFVHNADDELDSL